MKERLTEIISIVDRSGSMQSILDDAIGGFNTFLAAQQRQPGEAKLSLILFDHEYQVVHQAVDIQQVEPLNLLPGQVANPGHNRVCVILQSRLANTSSSC